MKKGIKNRISVLIRSTFVALAVMCLWSITVCAANVAMIGSAGYASLQDAVDAVQNKQTIVVKQAVKNPSFVKINGARQFTIDFGGHKYTYTGTADAFCFDAGSVTIKNAKIVSRYGAFSVGRKGNVIFESGTAYGYSENYGKLQIKNGSFSTKNTKDRTNTELLRNYGTLKISKGTFTGTKDNALCNFGTAKLSGGTFQCTASVKNADGSVISTGVYNDSSATLTVTGGKFISKGTVLLNRGTARITNGTFTSKNGAGIVNQGKSMYIYKTTVKVPKSYLAVRNMGSLTIKKGCKITGSVSNETEKSSGLTVAAGSTFAAVENPCVINRSGTVTIKGGTFTSSGSSVLDNYAGAVLKVVKGTFKVSKGVFVVVYNAGSVTLSGGTYKTDDSIVELYNDGSRAKYKLSSSVKKNIEVFSEQ